MSQPQRQFANPRLPAIWHGGDYNPDQWPPELLETDLKLMDEANCQVFSVGIFSWAALEPEEGKYTFEWLDRVMDRFAETGKYAALATPSAAMPAWMAQKYPEILRTEKNGIRNMFGNRVNFCWTSPEYRKRAREIAKRLAERYGKHPALVLWHVSNEYGGECYCDLCRKAFQDWLRVKFDDDLGRLNEAYWTAFWSHTFTDWSEIPLPGWPRGDDSMVGLSLDWRRFTSAQIVDFYNNEAAPLRPTGVPVTTNLMGTYPGLDYWRLAPHMDVIAWDSYPAFGDRKMGLDDWIHTAFKHDLNRSLKRKPFLMIESTPGSSNWYRVMSLKRPGAHRMEGMQALAHGSDAVMYFQWRQSRGSREKFHGAVVQHDRTSKTRIFREVAELGKELKRLAAVAGTQTVAEAAVIYDWENAWAIELAGGPRRLDMRYQGTCIDFYRALFEQSVPTDVIESTASLDPYKLVVAPMLYLVKPGVAESFTRFVEGGGTLVLTYYSGMVDENDLCFLGGFPGPLRELAGVWSEEIDALYEGETNRVRFAPGNDLGIGGSFEARELFEMIHAEGAEVLAEYESDFYSGRPSLTRKVTGKGETYFVASRNDAAFHREFMRGLVERAGLARDFGAAVPEGVFVRKRVAPEGEFLFVINFMDDETVMPWSESGFQDLESNQAPLDTLRLGAREARVFFRPSNKA